MRHTGLGGTASALNLVKWVSALLPVSTCFGMLQADAKMLTASGDQCVHLWDTASAQGLGQFRGHNGSVKSVCPNPDGQPTFTSGQAPATL